MIKNQCKWCKINKKMNSMDFCSIEHLRLDMEYRKINIPRLFLQRLIFRFAPEQRDAELKAYALRHKYDEALVFKKANHLMEQMQ